MKTCKTIYKGILLLTVTSLLLLFGCSDTVGGGASSEVTNASIYIDTTNMDNKIFFYEIVSSNATSKSTDTTYTGVTDSNGIANVSLPNTGTWSLIVKDDTSGIHTTFSTTDVDSFDIGPLTVGLFSTINGSVDLEGDPSITEVHLPGSPYTVPVDSKGNFSFESLPPGEWNIMASEKHNTVEVTLFEDESIDVININPPEGYDERKLLEEILTKHTDQSKTVDEIATFELVDGFEVATIVNLSGFDITLDSLDASGLPRMSNMDPIEVDFSNNGLTDLPNLWGWHWDRIERLDLSNNKITLIPHPFRDMKTLKVLDLSNNELEKINHKLTVLKPDSVLVAGNYLNDVIPEVEAWLDLYAESNWRELQRTK